MSYDFYVGVDLGQAHDFTAFSVIQQERSYYPKQAPFGTPAWENEKLIRKVTYSLRLLDRFPLNTPYDKIVRELLLLKESEDFIGAKVVYVIDFTGVGRPIVDFCVTAGIRPIIPITITSGEQVVQHKGSVSVPKRDLVYGLYRLHRSGRLSIAEGLHLLPEFMREVETFSIKLDRQTGNESFEAWRESDHDDLVLATALAAWQALLSDDDGKAQRKRQKRSRDYDPMEWDE